MLPLIHQVRDKRPGVASRTTVSNLLSKGEGVISARKLHEMGQPTEALTNSIEVEKLRKKGLNI